MLRYLGLSCFRCRPSIVALRWIHHATILLESHVLHDSPPAATDGPAGSVLLNRYGIRMDESFVADPNTVAYCRTYTGKHLCVSFKHAPPPASSFFFYDFPDSVPGLEEEDAHDDCEDDSEGEESEEEEVDVDKLDIIVVASHGDAALLKMTHRSCSYFEALLYRVGSATSPATMSLLPDRDFLTKTEQNYISPEIRYIVHSGTIGLLRRGDDDVMLVEPDLMYDRDAQRYMAEFCLLRHGMSQWELKEPVHIIQDEGGQGIEQLHPRSSRNIIIPLGDRFLCWVNFESGFLLCDMADEESPKVRYVPLPPVVCWDPKGYERDMSIKHSMNMGAAGPSAVRFVSIDPRCCCGGTGKSTCAHSRYAFTINTWLMNISIEEPLTWVKDGEIDCEEIWRLPGYEGLPQANPMCPVVCLDNSNVVCLLVSNYALVSSYEDRKLWMIQLNIKTKLLSVVPYNDDRWGAYDHLPVSLHSSLANTG
ncbi:unnamed protein product [Urochloa decumbens]|uniref:DUF1618 domain-containing protein n=1 Tax=Urochloa decumbens TaxID=240449 RepID=A0ABC9GWZ6_9POAL